MIRYYVTDRRSADVVVAAERAAAEGVDMIQVREKDLEANALYELVRAVLKTVKGSGTKVLVNDRLDVALAAGADGVHLPANGLPVSEVRPLIGLVGRSTHSLDAVRQAEAGGADFVVFGPVFETPGKIPVGVDRLRKVAEATTIPVLAIGGITSENTGAVIAAGAMGIAGIRLFQ
jgi:thiamine-phosphate pyrophosphorylase